MEPNKTVCDILNTVAAQVCDDLCKWPEKYRDGDDEQEELYAEHCNSCPLRMLGI